MSRVDLPGTQKSNGKRSGEDLSCSWKQLHPTYPNTRSKPTSALRGRHTHLSHEEVFTSHSVWQLGTLSSSLYNILSPHFISGGKELAVLLSTAVCQGPPRCLLHGSDPHLGRSEEQWGHHHLPLSEQSAEETLFEETENHKQLRADESHRHMFAATLKDSRTKKIRYMKKRSSICVSPQSPLKLSSYWSAAVVTDVVCYGKLLNQVIVG